MPFLARLFRVVIDDLLCTCDLVFSLSIFYALIFFGLDYQSKNGMRRADLSVLGICVLIFIILYYRKLYNCTKNFSNVI